MDHHHLALDIMEHKSANAAAVRVGVQNSSSPLIEQLSAFLALPWNVILGSWMGAFLHAWLRLTCALVN